MVHLIKDKEDLTKRLADAGTKLVLIDFYATWCIPCKDVAPQFEELSKVRTDVIFLKVDVDHLEKLTDEYEVFEIPSFVFIKESKVLEKFAADDLDKVQETIDKYV